MAVVEGRPVQVAAADGYPLAAHRWLPSDDPSGVVVINCATAVKAGYYHRFARYLSEQGFIALTYDYRGIGGSRQGSLRGRDISWRHWGQLDLEGLLRWAGDRHRGLPLLVVGHSFGGFAPALAGSNHSIARVLTVGAQYAFWRDYQADARASMVLQWHVFMPLLTALMGYFPGHALGWLEDVPAGVARDWASQSERFEDGLRRRRPAPKPEQIEAILTAFRSLTAPVLAVSVTDDPYGTVAATERALRYFPCAPRTHVRIAPETIGHNAIGHFGFFHDRFRDSLWRDALRWLKTGELSRPAFSQHQAACTARELGGSTRAHLSTSPGTRSSRTY